MKCQYCGVNEVIHYDLCDGCADHLYNEEEEKRMIEEMMNDKEYIKEQYQKAGYHWDFDFQTGTYMEYTVGYNGEKMYTGNTFND